MKKDNNVGALFICGASFLTWGLLAIYWSQLKHIGAMEIVAHRAIWSLIFAGVLVVAAQEAGQIVKVFRSPKLLTALAASSFMIALNWGIYIWAVTNEHIVQTSMGYYINPLFNVAAAALIFKVKMNRYQILAVSLAAFGVAILVIGYGSVPWVAIGLALSFCIYGVIRKIVPVDAIAGLFIETLIISVPAAIYIIFLTAKGEGVLVSGDGFSLGLLILGGIVTTLPLAGFAYGAKRLDLSTLGIIQYISPTTSFIIGVFLYHETFSFSHFVTFVFIWAGLAVYSADGIIRFNNQKRKKTAPGGKIAPQTKRDGKG